MAQKVKSHVFNGKRYNILFKPESYLNRWQAWAVCDAPYKPYKRRNMIFCKARRGLDELEDFIHESHHGLDWSKKEEYVTEISRDLARFLWKLGYRRVEQCPKKRKKRSKSKGSTVAQKKNVKRLYPSKKKR